MENQWIKDTLAAAGVEITDEVGGKLDAAYAEHTAGLTDGKAEKQKYDTDTKKLKDDAAKLQAALDEAKIEAATELELTKSGAKSLAAAKALLDKSKITLKDGSVEGLKEQIEQMKADNGFLFDAAGATGMEQGGAGAALNGVEQRFYELNPELKG